MNPKRFVAENARTALRQVRAELGLDAVILSNRTTDDGAEIVAVAMSDMGHIGALAQAAAPAPERAAPESVVPASLMRAVAPSVVPAAASVMEPQVLRSRRSEIPAAPAVPVVRVPAAPAFDPHAARSQEAAMLSEIRAMKSMLAEQVASFNWSETLRQRPLRGRVLRTLLDSGFSSQLSRSVVERLPDDFGVDAAHDWVAKVLARNLLTSTTGDITDRGGVYALVGPTGVGKTTTVAKLAARCVMKHGPSRLGLIMTDDYRIGAQDQLRIYGRLLGVPVYVAQTREDLQQALAAMADKHLVLIDTVGMGQHDARVQAQHDLLIAAGVQRLLVLNATAQAQTLDQVAQSYAVHRNRAAPLAGAILTKLDEAALPGCALDVLIRRKLQLHFCTSGQRVPEDLELANPAALATQALLTRKAAGEDSVFGFGDNEAGLFMTQPGQPLEMRT